jgi:hypothetical protein
MDASLVVSARNYEEAAKNIYVSSLLYPEKTVAKIPGPLPVSSATATIRNNFSITPNSQGKFLLVIDPFQSTGWLYQSNDVDGEGNGTVTNLTFDQNNTIVDQFRLVSSSVILRYYGNFNQMSGIFVSATTSNLNGQVPDDYLTFSNIEDLTNKYISKCVDGVKLIYTPMDNRAIEFRVGSDYTNGTHPCKKQYLFVIMGDLFPNSTCIRVDYYRNIEYTTVPAYREYILQSKSLPCSFEVPLLPATASAAPENTISTALANNNIPYAIKLMQYLNRQGITLNPNIFK